MKKKTVLSIFIVILSLLLISACRESASKTMNATISPDTTITPVQGEPSEAAPTAASSEPSANAQIKPADSPIKQYTVGNIIKFGGYEWVILDVRDGKALLLTKGIIALRFGNISDAADKALQSLAKKTMPYWELSDFMGYSAMNSKFDGIYDAYNEYASEHPEIFNDDMWYSSWENCSLRKWLNSEMDFTSTEWDMIATTDIVDKTALGGNTADKVFLLNNDDVEKYFPRNESREASCIISDEEILSFLQDSLLMGSLSGEIAEKAIESRNGGVFYWWVRGSAAGDNYIKPMSSDDELRSMAPSPEKPLGIRPAIWISIAA